VLHLVLSVQSKATNFDNPAFMRMGMGDDISIAEIRSAPGGLDYTPGYWTPAAGSVVVVETLGPVGASQENGELDPPGVAPHVHGRRALMLQPFDERLSKIEFVSGENGCFVVTHTEDGQVGSVGFEEFGSIDKDVVQIRTFLRGILSSKLCFRGSLIKLPLHDIEEVAKIADEGIPFLCHIKMLLEKVPITKG